MAITPLNCATMIPSSARRTLIFLLLSVLVFWGPDWLVPTAWEQTLIARAHGMAVESMPRQWVI